MPSRSSLIAAITSKGGLTVGAAVLMVGGGVAIAQNGAVNAGQGLDRAREAVVQNSDLDNLAAFCEERPGAIPFCDGPSEPEGPPDVPDEGNEACPDEVVELFSDDSAGALDADADCPDVGPEDSLEGDERSDTARRVHRALTGSDDIRPGDPEFGPTVSSRARTGQLGSIVSRAARGEELSEEDLDVGTQDPPGWARRGGDEDEPDDEAGPSARDDRGGPPPHAGNGNRGGPPPHAGGNGRGQR